MPQFGEQRLSLPHCSLLGTPTEWKGWFLPFMKWFLPEAHEEPDVYRRERCIRKQSPVFTPTRSRKALPPKEAKTVCGFWSQGASGRDLGREGCMGQ